VDRVERGGERASGGGGAVGKRIPRGNDRKKGKGKGKGKGFDAKVAKEGAKFREGELRRSYAVGGVGRGDGLGGTGMRLPRVSISKEST